MTKIALVTCVDSRLNEPVVDRFLMQNKENTVFVFRNAGANVRGIIDPLLETISAEGIGEVKIVCHTNCGAMGLVDDVLHKGKHVSEPVRDGVVLDYADVDFVDRKELEETNPVIQADYLRAMLKKRGLKDVKVTQELFETKAQLARPEDRTVIIAEAGSTSCWNLCRIAGVSPAGAYIVQSCVCADGIAKILPSVEMVAEELGVKKVVLVARDLAERASLDTNESYLKEQEFVKHSRASVVLACTMAKAPTKAPAQHPQKLKV